VAISLPLKAKKLATLTELKKPANIAIDYDSGYFYVTEGATVFVYSLKDYSFVKKFGKAGSGPQEFQVVRGLPVFVIVQKDYLQINSLNRLSYFTKNGEFIKERNCHVGNASLFFTPVKDRYLAITVVTEKGIFYNAYNLLDPDLQKIKTLRKVKRSAQRGGPIKLFSDSVGRAVFNDRIYLSDSENFDIRIYDYDGNEVSKITRKYERVKFGDKNKKDVWDSLEADPRTRAQIPILKQRMKFPDYFPAIASIFAMDDKFYVITWRYKGERFECFIYDKGGKLLKESAVEFRFQSPLQPYPLGLAKGKLFQLIENDEEYWELHEFEFVQD
jgi:hypothetical protein